MRGANIQVLHKCVEDFGAALRSVDALQHWSHVGRLNRLQDLGDGLQMDVLDFVSTASSLSTSSSSTHLHSLILSAHWCALTCTSERTLCITSANKLPDLSSDLAHLSLGDVWEGREESGDVEVLGGLWVQGVNVDCAPVVG